jgi:hypothetical protein
MQPPEWPAFATKWLQGKKIQMTSNCAMRVRFPIDGDQNEVA